MNFSSIGLSNITATTFTLTFVTPFYINYFQGFVAQSNSYTTAQQINNAASGSSPTAFMDFGLFFPVKNNTATTLSLGFPRFNSSYSGFGEQLGYPFCPGFNSTWYYYLVDINGVLSRPVAFTYSFYTNTLRLSTTSYTTLTIANLAPILSVTSDATVVYSYAGANSTTYGPSATKPTAVGTYKLSYTGTGGYFYCSLPILFTVTQASDQTLNVKVNNTTQVYTGSPLLLAPVSFSRRFIDTRFNISWDETSITGTPTVTVYYYILVNSEYIQVQHMYYPGTYYVNAIASAGYKARLVDGHAALGYQRLDIVNGTNLPYVAGNTVGNNSATNTTSLLTSPNLINWTSIPAWYGGDPGQYLGGTINIITVNDVMFAVGADSAGLAGTVLLYSADGVTWAKPASMPAGLVVISTLTYINGYYIAACSTGSQGMVMYATDYTGTWTAVSTKFYSSTTGAYVAGTFGMGVFVIVGGVYGNSNPVNSGFYYSTDLISNYTYVNTPGFQITGTVVEFDGTKFIAVGWETGANNFRVSYDGKAWSSSGFSGDTSFTGVPQSIKYAFMNHLNRYLWIAVSGQQAKYSTDGLAWTNYPASSGILNSFWNLTWSGARWFVGVVDSSVSYQFSFDGITWYNIYIAQVNSSTYHSTTGGTMFAKERYLTDIQPISLTNAYTGSALTPSVSSVTLPSPNRSLYYQDANGNSIANMINAGNYTVTAILWGASGATKYAGISKYAYTVTPATPTLSASNVSFTYSVGVSRSPTITTNSTGSITYSYSNGTYGPSATAPINVGTYSLTASQAAAGNYSQGSINVSFTISAGASSIAVTGNTSFTYNGAAQGPSTSSVSGSTGAVTYYYSGAGSTSYGPNSTTAPTNVGTYSVYAVVAADANSNSATSQSVSFSIVALPIPINVYNTTQRYNNSVYTPSYSASGVGFSYSTSPANVSVSITYYRGWNGGSIAGLTQTPMRAIGSYTGVITVTDPSYSGSHAFQFEIIVGLATISLTNLLQQYTGSALNIGPATNPINGETDTMSYNFSSTPLAAGTYNVLGAFGSLNNYIYTISGSTTFTITSAPAVITINDPTSARLTQRYGSLVPLLTSDASIAATPTFPTGTVVYTYTDLNNNASTSFPSAVGSYTVTAAVPSNTNYSYSMARIYTLVIQSLSVNFSINPTALTYTTVWLSTFLTYVPNCNTPWSYTGQNILYPLTQIPPSTVGSYTVAPVNTNTNLIYNPSGTTIFVINKADVTVTINPATLTQYYTGFGVGVSVTTSIPVQTVVISYTSALGGSPTTVLPIALGTYNVSAVIQDINYQGSASATLTILPVTCILTFQNLANIFTGFPISATVTTTPGGHPVNLTYTPFNNVNSYTPYAPINVGSYYVRGVVDQTTQVNFNGMASTLMTITRLTIPLFITNNTQTYTTNALTNTSLTNPTGLNVIYTYTPSPPINVGTYSVSGVIQDANYGGSAVSTLIITKATAPITFSSLTQVYNTSNLYATVATTPPGLLTNTQYTVGTTISPLGPVNVGAYTFITTINDANYAGANSATINITKLSTLVNLTQLNQVYNGAIMSSVVVTQPAGLPVSTLYNGSPTPPSSVGSYAVTATIMDSNYAGFTSNTFNINKLSTFVTLTNLVQNYTGSAITPTISANPINLLQNMRLVYSSITGTPVSTIGPIINAGKYAVSAIIQDNTYTGLSTSILSINPASTPVTFYSTQQVYTSRPLAPTFVTTPPNLSTSIAWASNGVPIVAASSVGMYSTTIFVNDSNNYFGNYGGSVTSGFQISKATAAMTFLNSQITSTYTGNSFAIPALFTTPSNLAVTYLYSSQTYLSATPPSAVNTYTVIGSIQDNNYMGFGSTILNITKGQGGVSFTTTSIPYDGLPHSTIFFTTPVRGMNVARSYSTIGAGVGTTTNPPTNIGSYIEIVSLLDSTFTATATSPLTITQGVASITIPAVSKTYNGLPATPPVISVVPNTLAASVVYSNAQYFSSSPPSTTGVYTMIAAVNTALYSNAATSLLTINKQTIPIALTGLQQVYNGSPLNLHTVTNPPNLAANYTFRNNISQNFIALPSSIGTYTVTASLNDTNYAGTKSAQLTIVLGPPQSVSAYPIPNGAIVTWSPPYFNGGQPITNYIVNTIPATTTITTPNTFTSVTGLTNGVTYLFTVKAVSALASSGGLTYQSYVSTFFTSTALKTPTNAVVANGTVYIADTGNHVIRKLQAGAITTMAGSVGNPGSANAQGTSASFNNPTGIVMDTIGNIYIADTGNNQIRRIDPTSNVTTYASGFNAPRGVTIDTAGILYVADTANNQIRKVDVSRAVTTYAGTGNVGHADGSTAAATFYAPQGITIDRVGNVYVADTSNSIIRKIDTTLRVSTIAGTPGAVGYVDSNWISARFSYPTGIALNGENLLFIADTGNHTIRKLDPTTNIVTSFAGYGVQGAINSDGANATFTQPTGICFDSNMTMYVTEAVSTIRSIAFSPLGSASPADASSNFIPGRPTNVVATAEMGSTSVFLSWTPPPATVIPISSYIITYTTEGSSSSSTVTINDGSLSSYIIEGLTGNVQYSFSVKATNLFGTGQASSPIQFAITQLPVAFSIASTIIFDDKMNSSLPVIETEPVVSFITSYTDAGGNPILTPTEIGVYNGVAQVNTSQYYGISTFTFTILNSKPSAPVRAFAVAGNGQAKISWLPPSDSGETAITSYTVISNPDGVTLTVTDTSAVLAGLTNATPYVFTVAANNQQGRGPVVQTNAVVPVGPPSAPQNVQATVSIQGIVTISWLPPLTTNGSNIAMYIINGTPYNSQGLTLAIALGSSVTTYTFTSGPTAGVQYIFSVTAINGVGFSAPTPATYPGSELSYIVPYTIPEAPVIVSATAAAGSVTLTWSIHSPWVPANDTNEDTPLSIKSFVINYTPNVANVALQSLSGSATQFTITGLTPKVAYAFSIYATNSIGNGLIANTQYITIPVGLTATNPMQYNLPVWYPYSTKIPVTFTITNASPYYNGFPQYATILTSYSNVMYSVVYKDTLGNVVSRPTAIGTYTATLTAVSLFYSGSQAFSFSILIPTPSAPRTILVQNVGSAVIPTINLAWTAPLAQGQSPIVSYTIVTTPPTTTITTTNTNVQITSGLQYSTSYQFTITANNTQGAGISATSASITPSSVPSEPQAAVVPYVINADGSVALSWRAPASAGGLSITSYTANITNGPTIPNISGTSYTINANVLTFGQSYSVTVVANNTNGAGPTLSIGPFVPGTPPSAPLAASTPFVANLTNGYVTLNWIAPSFNNGASITSYVITPTNTATSQTSASYIAPNVLTFQIQAGLTFGATYSFAIQAHNAFGDSAALTIGPVTPGLLPLSPQSPNLSINSMGNQVITWIQPDSANITGYTLTMYENESLVKTINPGLFDLFINGTAISYTLIPRPSSANQVTFYYRIVAVKSGNPSSFAQTNSITVPVPILVNASNEGMTFTCTWSIANYSGPVTYNIKFFVFNAFISQLQEIISVMSWPNTSYSYTVPALLIGSYYFEITAVTSNGSSLPVKSNSIN